MVCWVFRLFSASWLNAPQLVRSSGIGLAATHLALTKPLKSWHALIFGSSSLTSKMLLPRSAAAVVLAAAGAALAVLAGVLVGADSCSLLPHAVSDKARLTARARGFRYCLVMDIPL